MVRTISLLSASLIVSLLFVLSSQIVSAHYFVPSSSGASSPYNAVVSTTNEPPQASVPQIISISLTNRSSGSPINLSLLDIVHERYMHVFIIGKDLQTFAHIHPDDFSIGFQNQSTGIYQVPYTFEKSGAYAVVVDITIFGQNLLYLIPLQVISPSKSSAQSMSSPALSAPDYNYSLTKTFADDSNDNDTYTVTLQTPAQIPLNTETPFTYFIQRNGKNVTDLQLFLDSEIHVLAIKDDLSTAQHTHAYIPGHALHIGTMAQQYTGPTIPVHLTFTTPGTYALFGQFQVNGTVITTQFLIKAGSAEDIAVFNISVWLEVIGNSLIVSVGVFFIARDFQRKRLKKMSKSKKQ